MEFTPDQKGGIAELAIASPAALLGVGVSRPMVEGLRYDLIFDWHLGLQRVQCKGQRTSTERSVSGRLRVAGPRSVN